MDLELNDLHVLVTGGSKGIGLACARAFLAEGARVSLVSRDAATLATAAAQLRESIGERDAVAGASRVAHPRRSASLDGLPVAGFQRSV